MTHLNELECTFLQFNPLAGAWHRRCGDALQTGTRFTDALGSFRSVTDCSLMVHLFLFLCGGQLLRRELHEGTDGSHGDRVGRGLPRPDSLSVTVVILDDGRQMTMGLLYR